jgi:hypothetical protein
MTFARDILGLLLIAALAMATLATSALTAAEHASGSSAGLLAGPGERPEGCHAHGGKSLSDSQLPRIPVPHSPPSAPAGYQCCLTGHNVAAVQASHYTPPSYQWTRVILQIAPPLTEYVFNESEVSMVVFADPPGITPLRI